MELSAFFPRLSGRRPLQMRAEDRPAPRLEALVGQAGQMAAPEAGRAADARMEMQEYDEQERRAMRLQIANEVLMEAREAALATDLAADVDEDDAPEPAEIHQELPEWAVGLSRTVTLPATDAETALNDLDPTQRVNLARVAETLTETFGQPGE